MAQTITKETTGKRLIATYGSLKRGYYNHGRMGEQRYVGSSKIRGHMTLVSNAYPQLYLDNDGDEHDVEVFEVDDEVYERLNRMEVGAGYAPRSLKIPQGEAIMWVYEDRDMMRGVPIKKY